MLKLARYRLAMRVCKRCHSSIVLLPLILACASALGQGTTAEQAKADASAEHRQAQEQWFLRWPPGCRTARRRASWQRLPTKAAHADGAPNRAAANRQRVATGCIILRLDSSGPSALGLRCERDGRAGLQLGFGARHGGGGRSLRSHWEHGLRRRGLWRTVEVHQRGGTVP